MTEQQNQQDPGQKQQPWYKSPVLIKFLVAVGGFGFFTLLGYFISQLLVQK